MIELDYEPVAAGDVAGERIAQVHRQAWTSPQVVFDDVMKKVYAAPAGYVLVDPFVLHDGRQWHLFYVTGRIEHLEAWREALRNGDDEAIAANPQAVADVRAGGKKQKKAFGFLMGQVMQRSRGAAQPGEVQRLLRAKLGGGGAKN